jgi:hypothetical protein
MRVIIEANVFEKSCVATHHLALVALFTTKWHHTIEIEPTGDDNYYRWVAKESVLTQERCAFVLKKSRLQRARRSRTRMLRIADVQTSTWSPIRLSPDEALRFLQLPLQLLVENARNERKFLGIMTRVAIEFDLEALIRNRTIEVHTKGGISENRKWIEEYGDVPEDTRRMWVMCDSDARQAWLNADGKIDPERLSDDARKLKELCEKRGIPIHILHRRAIENYVPLKLLEQWSRQKENRSERHQALLSLTDEQRHHYNMKEGFEQDARDPEYARKVGNLYDGITPEVRLALGRGFKDGRFGVADLFDETKSHDKMKPLRVHESWIRNDKQEAEARQIAEAIQELL